MTPQRFSSVGQVAPDNQRECSAQAYVQVDAVELSLVILNLFKNASEATRHTTDPQVDVKLESNGSMWELAVSDNGPTVDVSMFQICSHRKRAASPPDWAWA